MQIADSNCSDLRKKKANSFNSMLPEFILVATRYFEAKAFLKSYEFFKNMRLMNDITGTENVRMIKSLCKEKPS